MPVGAGGMFKAQNGTRYHAADAGDEQCVRRLCAGSSHGELDVHPTMHPPPGMNAFGVCNFTWMMPVRHIGATRLRHTTAVIAYNKRERAARPSGRTRTDNLFEQLKLAIIRGDVAPGDRLTEEGVAGRYTISRTPVREAFRRLEQEGWLTHLSFGGYTVRPIDFEEMTELYDVRVALEEVSAARACGRPSPHLERLEAFWNRPPADENADLNMVFADEDFHETLAAIGGNLSLHRMLKGVNERLHILRTRDFAAIRRIDATYQQHAGILQAVRQGDARLASALIRSHILESLAYVEQAARAALRTEQ